MSFLEIALTNGGMASGLALIALAAQRLVRRPPLTHALWLLVLLKLVTPPMWDIPLLKLDTESTTTQVVAAEPELSLFTATRTRNAAESSEPIATTEAPASLGALAAAEPAEREQPDLRFSVPMEGSREDVETSALLAGLGLEGLIIGLWLFGSVIVLGAMSWRALRFSRVLSEAPAASEPLQQRLGAAANSLGALRPPQLRVVPSHYAPMLWSFFSRPVVLWPQALEDNLDEGAQTALLTHELVHWKRGDHWVRHLELLACALWWWCPLAWWARSQIHTTAEACVDARVCTAHPALTKRYASALLDAIDHMAATAIPNPPVACGLGSRESLEWRLKMILTEQISGSLSRRSRVAVCALALLLPVIPGAIQEERQEGPPPAAVVDGKPISVEEMTANTLRSRWNLKPGYRHNCYADLVLRNELALAGLVVDPKVQAADYDVLVKLKGEPSGPSIKRALQAEAWRKVGIRMLGRHNSRIDLESSGGSPDLLGQFFLRNAFQRYKLELAEDGNETPSSLDFSVVHEPSQATWEVTRAQVAAGALSTLSPFDHFRALEHLIDSRILDTALAEKGLKVTEAELDQWEEGERAKNNPPFTWEQILRMKGLTAPEARLQHKKVLAWRKLSGETVADADLESFRKAHSDYFMGGSRTAYEVVVYNRDPYTGVPYSGEQLAEAKRRLDAVVEQMQAEGFLAEAERMSPSNTLGTVRQGIGDGISSILVKSMPEGRRSHAFVEATADLLQPDGKVAVVETPEGWSAVCVKAVNTGMKSTPDWAQPRFSAWVRGGYEVRKASDFFDQLKTEIKVERSPRAALLKQL